MTDENESTVFTFNRSNMFGRLLQLDPSFHSEWERFQDKWGNADEAPLYLALSELALHLIRNLHAGETDRFGEIFGVVEGWIIEGDDYVREAAIVGLLEDLQNTSLHRTTSPDDFKQWLQPQSTIWWTKVDAFWTAGTPLA
ncbi:DUF7674 family protein [Mesorhizobium loti]|uniref:DUF7674 domain-containing protein n=1 Tax=Mesorhizobium loti R88b TaxID=935548 RepID=A0A6M7WGJ4_RHILI|nr:hypothetical protein [Mesorhizobium loti]QKD02990.1 hypothetical protein EB235_16980 [Mesorhizobium loti R88b]